MTAAPTNPEETEVDEKPTAAKVFREAARAAILAQLDERITLAWQVHEARLSAAMPSAKDAEIERLTGLVSWYERGMDLLINREGAHHDAQVGEIRVLRERVRELEADLLNTREELRLVKDWRSEFERLRAALTDRLRPRLNGIFGALLGQGSTLAGEMRKALDVLDGLAAPVSSVEPEQDEPPFKPGDLVKAKGCDDDEPWTVGEVKRYGDRWKVYDAHTAIAMYGWADELEPAEQAPTAPRRTMPRVGTIPAGNPINRAVLGGQDGQR